MANNINRNNNNAGRGNQNAGRGGAGRGNPLDIVPVENNRTDAEEASLARANAEATRVAATRTSRIALRVAVELQNTNNQLQQLRQQFENTEKRLAPLEQFSERHGTQEYVIEFLEGHEQYDKHFIEKLKNLGHNDIAKKMATILENRHTETFKDDLNTYLRDDINLHQLRDISVKCMDIIENGVSDDDSSVDSSSSKKTKRDLQYENASEQFNQKKHKKEPDGDKKTSRK